MTQKERWAELFAAKDRDGLILQALVYVRKYNSRTPAFLKSDVEMYAVQRAIVAIDHCLQQVKESEKASAYTRQSVINAISNARKGKARKYVSTNVRTSEPKKRTNRELETKLRQSGLSDSMVEAELCSAGYQPCGKTKAVESQWPVSPIDNANADFAGNASGKHHGPDVLESVPVESDDWEFLAEVLTNEQFDYLKLRAACYTRGEIENDYGVTVQEQDEIMRDIKAIVQGDG